MGKVTSRDVAREVGVSQNTVSLVVRHRPRVRAEPRLVVGAMARLHHQPDAEASALRSQTTQSLAFVVAAGDLHNHVPAELLGGPVEGATAHDFTVVVVPSPPEDFPLDVALMGNWSVEAGRAAAAELLARSTRSSAIFALSDRRRARPGGRCPPTWRSSALTTWSGRNTAAGH